MSTPRQRDVEGDLRLTKSIVMLLHSRGLRLGLRADEVPADLQAVFTAQYLR